MTKSDAIQIFGSRIELAEALDVTPQAISQWPDELTPALADRVVGAALRLGKAIPRAVMTSHRRQRFAHAAGR